MGRIEKAPETISSVEDLIHGFAKKHDLTERELEVLSHVIQGKSAKEIAGILNISYRTIENHIGSIGKKTDIRTLELAYAILAPTLELLLKQNSYTKPPAE